MTTLVEVPAADPSAPEPRRRPAALIGAVADLLVLSAVTLFAAWTVCYLLALAGLVPSAAAFWLWVATAPVVEALVLTRLRRVLDGIPSASPWVPLAVGVIFAIGALVVVRPDLDDASYVVRSTWIAAHGDVRVGDVVFSGGRWPGMAFQTPYLQSIEALLGWLARVTGLQAGTVVYVLFPPVAAFLGVWALGMLLRAWRARAVSAGVLLAAVFLGTGGATHASWGNLDLARIWQGKVTFLAVVVPLTFALCATFWSAEERRTRRAALALVGCAGIAGIGLSTAAVFVVPGIAVVALAPGLVARRWADAVRLFLVGALPCLLAGVTVVWAGESAGGVLPQPDGSPWQKVLGDGVPPVVVGLAVVAAVLVPRAAAAGPVGRWTALAAVLAGVAVAVPAVYAVAVHLMGTNAVAWRLTWIVPVPALVGLLAGLRWGRVRFGLVVAAAVAAALVAGGVPLWSAANGAWIAAPPNWKMPSSDLAAARWVASVRPGGPVLAPATTSAALGAVTADVRPVGTREDYMVMYVGAPGTRMDQRLVLQHLADGGADPADVAAAPGALAALHVGVACGHPGDALVRSVLLPAGYRAAFTSGPLTCYVGG